MIIHKVIKKGRAPWVYLCNQAVRPKNFPDKCSYTWGRVTCRNCLKQIPEIEKEVKVKHRKNWFRVSFLLFFWFLSVVFWWILLPVGNFVNWVTGFNHYFSFDEYFEWMAEEVVCILESGGLCG